MSARAWVFLLWLLTVQSALACGSGTCHSDCCTVDEFCGTVKRDCSQAQISCHVPTAQDQAEVILVPEGPRFILIESEEPLPCPRVINSFTYSGIVESVHEAPPAPPPVPPPR